MVDANPCEFCVCQFRHIRVWARRESNTPVGFFPPYGAIEADSPCKPYYMQPWFAVGFPLDSWSGAALASVWSSPAFKGSTSHLTAI
jgi:hypothetical protein